jgi:hypothetical protein
MFRVGEYVRHHCTDISCWADGKVGRITHINRDYDLLYDCDFYKDRNTKRPLSYIEESRLERFIPPEVR